MPVRSVPCIVSAAAGSDGSGARQKQQGVVLFFTLIALLAMSLAAVALIRSIDTGSMIVGNLAFKHAATTSADAGIEASMIWLAQTTANAGLEIRTEPTHPLNNTDLVNHPGYHATFDPDLDVLANSTWNDADSVLIPTDIGGHQVRYIIQRLCRNEGAGLENTDCLLAYSELGGVDIAVLNSSQSCDGKPCDPAGTPAQMRVTIRAESPVRSTSFVQGNTY